MNRLAIGAFWVPAFSAFGSELGWATEPSQTAVDQALATVKRCGNRRSDLPQALNKLRSEWTNREAMR